MSQCESKTTSVPFDPPTCDNTHEYRVRIVHGRLHFATQWYIEGHARQCLTDLQTRYPSEACRLERRTMTVFEGEVA